MNEELRLTSSLPQYFCLCAIMFFDNGTPCRVGLKLYTSLCGRTIPRACFGDIQHMFSVTRVNIALEYV